LLESGTYVGDTTKSFSTYTSSLRKLRAENGQIIEHKPITFYQVESFNPSLKPRMDEAKEEFLDDDSTEEDICIEVLRYF
jgi:hypothetical protein